MAALPSPLKVSEPTGGPMAITSPMRGSSGAGGLSSALAVAGTQFHPFPHDEITLRFMYRRMDGNDEVCCQCRCCARRDRESHTLAICHAESC